MSGACFSRACRSRATSPAVPIRTGPFPSCPGCRKWPRPRDEHVDHVDAGDPACRRLVAARSGLAVRRNLAVVAVYKSQAGETIPSGFTPAGWIAGIAVGTEARFLAGALDGGQVDVPSVLRRSPLPASEAVETAVSSDLTAARGTD